jgi:hypothetical protein
MANRGERVNTIILRKLLNVRTIADGGGGHFGGCLFRHPTRCPTARFA